MSVAHTRRPRPASHSASAPGNVGPHYDDRLSEATETGQFSVAVDNRVCHLDFNNTPVALIRSAKSVNTLSQVAVTSAGAR